MDGHLPQTPSRSSPSGWLWAHAPEPLLAVLLLAVPTGGNEILRLRKRPV